MPVTPIDLYAFGNRRGPRPPRLNVDLFPDSAGMVGPESPPFPSGASTFADIRQAPVGGHYFKLPRGTVIPAEIDIVADGVDVDLNSRHPPTHHTIYPFVRMHIDRFLELFLNLPWQYVGRK
jgi:hypothetical protein